MLDGACADLLIVSACTGSELGLFVVECEAAGVELRSRPTVDGTRKQAAVELELLTADQFEEWVRPDRMLGPRGEA